jgi:ABC-type lipoprotein release transport system permease subunit
MAFTIGYTMLLRRGVAAQSILAIALLVAVVASTNSIANYLNLQSETLAGFVNPRGTYLILSSNSTAVTDSKLPIDLTARLRNLSYVRNVLPQRMLTADLTIKFSSRTILVRGVEDIGSFLKTRGAYLNGTAAENWMEADIGEILAKTLRVSLGDEVSLAVGERSVEVRVVGVFRSQTQSDSELLVPIETAGMLSGDYATVSLIEFSLKDSVDSREALGRIAELLPGNVRIVEAQQLKGFVQQINMQTVGFLNIWSTAVYAAMAAASYIAAARLITESSYELAMLKALGARKSLIFTLILAYTATVALLGSILGVALGTAGTQVASTILRWITPSVDIAPFLLAEQAIRILLSTIASSILGCIYPALKSARTKYVEQPF